MQTCVFDLGGNLCCSESPADDVVDGGMAGMASFAEPAAKSMCALAFDVNSAVLTLA